MFRSSGKRANMPWVDVEEIKKEEQEGSWLDIPKDIANKAIEHFKRIPEIYQEQTQAGMKAMENMTQNPLPINMQPLGDVAKGFGGGLQTMFAAPTAVIKSLYREPTEQLRDAVYEITSGGSKIPENVKRISDIAIDTGEQAIWSMTPGKAIQSKLAPTPKGLEITQKLGIKPQQLQGIINEASAPTPLTKEQRLFTGQTTKADVKETFKEMIIEDIHREQQHQDILNKSKQLLKDNGINADFLGTQTVVERLTNNPNPFNPEKISTWGNLKEKADELAGMVSTRVGNISPTLKNRMRKYVFEEGLNTNRDLKAIDPFYKKFNKLPKREQFQLTELLSNGKIQEAEEVFLAKGMLPEFRIANRTKDILWQKAKEAGLEAGDIPNHFPRKVTNYEALKQSLGSEQQTMIDRSIAAIEKKYGRLLSAEEKAKLTNNILRGYDPAKLGLSGPGFSKERKLTQLTPELTQYYAPAHDSLKDYIESLNRNIASNKLLGKDVGGDVLSQMGIDTTEQSIGSLITKMKMQGENITPKQEDQLKKMLSAVVKPTAAGKITQNVKDITYGTTLTNLGPALTQVQDLTLSLEKEGFFNTLKGLGKAISGVGKVGVKDLGIDKIAEEMRGSKTPIDWVLKQGLKWSGFNAIDRLGKETLINGALSKYQKLARNNPAKLAEKIRPLFMNDTSRVVGDLVNKNVTSDVKFLLFNELSDVQPISRIEVPEKYLTSDSGKLFYVLKTYQLKLFDIYRREIFQEIKKGNVKEGLGRLGRLTTGLVVLGAGVDEIKDFVFNRKTSFSDKVIDNFLKLGGFSKYTTWQARKEGLGKALLSQIMPATGLANDISKDVMKLYDEQHADTKDKRRNARHKGYETVKDIPLVGKPYYWWLGEGDVKEKKRQKNHNY